ncbi:hypothetical protein B0I37DRAFT_362795 [Chaetomium sp. MPI-CAGE-AT-0009]|nr:hypothetical protein B0I37DRAFT_362795 [Chaetomium sp. MPI-CAGE-AT-0009]
MHHTATMSSSHSETTPANKAPDLQAAAESGDPSGGTLDTRPQGGYGPTKEQLAAAHAALARLEAEGVIKPFVVRYPRWVLDDGTVLCEGSGPEAGVETTTSSKEEPAPPEGPKSDNSVKEARL